MSGQIIAGLLKAIKNAPLIDGLPQTGTPLYAIARLVQLGHPFPESEVGLIERLADEGHYEQRAMASMLLEAIDGR